MNNDVNKFSKVKILDCTIRDGGYLNWSLNLINISLYPLIFIIICIPIYILIVGVIMYLFPKITGIEKEEVLNFIYAFNKIFHKI